MNNDVSELRFCGMTHQQRILKRLFDVFVSSILLILLSWLILLIWIVVSVTSRSNGIFTQQRVGYLGKKFNVLKFRTMHTNDLIVTSVTTANDPRITSIGRWLRRTKLDELPQLWNVLTGNMSLVGPRPDVSGFADRLCGDEQLILSVRPGITGPATLKYRDEEELLSLQDDPESYNREVIYPDKVNINLQYIKNWSFSGDLKYLRQTIFE